MIYTTGRKTQNNQFDNVWIVLALLRLVDFVYLLPHPRDPVLSRCDLGSDSDSHGEKVPLIFLQSIA